MPTQHETTTLTTMTAEVPQAPYTVNAVIDVCSNHTAGSRDDKALHGTPHSRFSLFSKPQKVLWCLGYYDQARQNNHVVIQVLPDPSGDADNDSEFVIAERPWQGHRAKPTGEVDLVGAIVRDMSVEDESARYAVGRTGFLCLRTGTFVTYDAAFPGPEFFAGETFGVEEPPLRTPAPAEVAGG